MKRKQRLPGFLERIPKIRAIGKRAQTAFRKACERIGVQPQQLIFEAVNLGLINPKGTKIFFEGKYAAATTLQIYAFLLARAREGAEREFLSMLQKGQDKKRKPKAAGKKLEKGEILVKGGINPIIATQTKQVLLQGERVATGIAKHRGRAERSVIVFAPGKKPRPMYGIARILTGTSFMPAYLIYNYFTNTKRTLTAKTASTLELELIEIFQKFGL